MANQFLQEVQELASVYSKNITGYRFIEMEIFSDIFQKYSDIQISKRHTASKLEENRERSWW